MRSSNRLLALTLSGCLGGGCATVKPQEKELLADPAMIYGSGGAVAQQEQHTLENREGMNESSASGGGCGCN